MWYTIEAVSVTIKSFHDWRWFLVCMPALIDMTASLSWYIMFDQRANEEFPIVHDALTDFQCVSFLLISNLIKNLNFNFPGGIFHFLEGFTLLYLPFFTYLLKVTSESLLSNPLKTIKQLFLFIAFIWKQFLMDDGTLPFNSWLRKRQFLIFKICLSRIRICTIANEHI